MISFATDDPTFDYDYITTYGDTPLNGIRLAAEQHEAFDALVFWLEWVEDNLVSTQLTLP